MGNEQVKERFTRGFKSKMLALEDLELSNWKKLYGRCDDYAKEFAKESKKDGKTTNQGAGSALTEIRILSLDRNKFEDPMPSGLAARFPQLRTATLTHNKISGDISELFRLPCIETVNLSHNKLKALPALGAAPKLKELRVSDNQLQFQPSGRDAAIFVGCVSLKVLYLDGNRISVLPDSFFIAGSDGAGGSLQKLAQLNISSNILERFGPSGQGSCGGSSRGGWFPALQTLDVSSNKLSDLPDELFMSCPSLRSIQFDGNLIALKNVLERKMEDGDDKKRDAAQQWAAKLKVSIDKQLAGGLQVRLV